MDGPNSLPPHDLFTALGTAAAPLVFDVRRPAAFEADQRMLVAAQRRAPDRVTEWLRQIPASRQVIVYCVHGHEVSQEVAAALRQAGIDAWYLAGGIAGWAELGLPLRDGTPAQGDRS
jgi:rhodanese-related sulfurtransferase